MKLSTLFANGKTVVSYELFPPKPDSPIEKMYATLDALQGLRPDYISITYGAAGLNNKRTLELASIVKNKYDIEPLAHLTALYQTKASVKEYLSELGDCGIENVLALRGDIVGGARQCEDFHHASDLVTYIKSISDINIVAAGYPEGHFESENLASDMFYLKKKIDAGASHINTQLFFDNSDFFCFLERCKMYGVTVPIQAGIMPIIKKSQVERILTLTGAKVPQSLSRIFARYSDNPDALRDAGIAYATQQIVDLITAGVDGIHLYIMNNDYVARKINENIASLIRG